MKIISIPEEKLINGSVFPLTISPNESVKEINSAVEFIKSNLNQITLKLLQHGAILFRGFPISGPKEFNDFALAFGWKTFSYISI
jgi:hypothetical protein